MITHDRETMTRYFVERLVAGKWNNPGLFIVPQGCAIGPTIEFLLLVWAASPEEEWRDRIVFLSES
jgi:hypothetical protein